MGVCIYNCRRKRIPVGNGSYKKEYLIFIVRVYRVAWMDESSMLLVGPGSAFGGNKLSFFWCFFFLGGGGQDNT